jgi:transcriptional regulator with GAF, ATPase, and Fis domain/tetratricopeptide (TPR) repeat protein
MIDERLEQGNASRYITKKVLGEYPPWRGYSVTDSLSEKNFLRFTLLPGEPVALSLADLVMREALFADDTLLPTLSLQKNNGEITFLLPYLDLIPLTKALPSMKPQKSAEMTKTLLTTVLTRFREGLFFGNLSPESVVLVGRELRIIPTAYLLPTEILAHLKGQRGAMATTQAAILEEVGSIGVLLDTCSRYLSQDKSQRMKELSSRFTEAKRGCDGTTLYGLIGKLISALKIKELKPFVPPGMETSYVTPTTAMKALDKAVRGGGEGERLILIVNGRQGEGKSRFLREAMARLTGVLGFEGGVLLSDRNLFHDAELESFADSCDFIAIDDHTQEPLVSCHIIDRLCRDIKDCRLAMIAVNEKSPTYFIDALKEVCKRKSVRIADITLPLLGAAEKRRAVSSVLPKRSGRKASSRGRTLASMDFEARATMRNDQSPGTAYLDGLSEEDRSILNFIALFRFEVPLSLLQNIYSAGGGDMYSTIQTLRSMGLITARAEVSSLADDELCLLYKVASRSLASDILKKIPEKRKQQIQRNIAFILKEMGGAPPLYIFHHLARGGEMTEAAQQGYLLFQSLLGRQNLSAINCFNESFMNEKLDRHLPPEARFNLMLELGDFFALIGSTDRAEVFYRRCREDIDKDEQPAEFRTLAVEAARKECEILEKRGDFVKAEKLLDRALDLHGEYLKANERAKLYNDLAWVHYRMGQFDKSLENCLLVHKLLDEKHHPLEIAQTYNLMGTINWNRTDYEEAVICHKKCLALRENCNEEIGVATSYNNLGLAYLSMGRIDDAIECFKKSMKIKQRHHHLPGLAAVNLNIALAHLEMGELEEAQQSCLTAMRLAEDIGNQQLLAEVYGTLGEIKHLLGQHGTARDYYYKDLHICQNTRSQREKAIVYRRLSGLCHYEGKHDEARELLKQAKSLNKGIGSRLEMCLLNVLEARILLAEGKRENGKRMLEGASLELSLIGRKAMAAVLAAEAGNLYHQEGNDALAREHLLRATSLLGDVKKMPKQVQDLLDAVESDSALSLEEIGSDSDRFKVLCRLISIIRTVHDPDKLNGMIVETARNITGMERAALIIQENGKKPLRILAESGPKTLRATLSDKNVETIFSITRKLGYPFDVSRVNLPTGKISETFLEKHPGIVCIPLIIEDEVTGFLYLDSSRPSTGTSDEDHSFLVAFSQQVALGLERIILSERLRTIEVPRPARPSVQVDKDRGGYKNIIGNSPTIRHIFELIEDIKDMDMTVLLIGENGTGKDMFARAIHHNSYRRKKPFVSLNCATIPRELIASELFGHEKGAFTGAHKQRVGHFESANGGTIFLNEIRDLPIKLQPTLLRVLEEQKFYRVGGRKEISTDLRIIAATNVDLLDLVKEDQFRIDLYYRLNIFPIRIPALRERKEDIELLCNHFLATYARMYHIPAKKITMEVLTYLFEYNWPGNVRELENVMHQLTIMTKKDTIMVEDLPEVIVQRPKAETASLHTSLDEAIEMLLDTVESPESEAILNLIELEIIRHTMQRLGSVQEASKFLGLSKPTIYNKLKKLNENST